MPKGRVKWFSPVKGYGFIIPEEGSAEIFFHISEVEKADILSLEPDEKIMYDLEKDEKGKVYAVNLKQLR